MEVKGDDWTASLDVLAQNYQFSYLDYLLKKHTPPKQAETNEEQKKF